MRHAQQGEGPRASTGQVSQNTRRQFRAFGRPSPETSLNRRVRVARWCPDLDSTPTTTFREDATARRHQSRSCRPGGGHSIEVEIDVPEVEAIAAARADEIAVTHDSPEYSAQTMSLQVVLEDCAMAHLLVVRVALRHEAPPSRRITAPP